MMTKICEQDLDYRETEEVANVSLIDDGRVVSGQW
jgi:hypothetical protein